MTRYSIEPRDQITVKGYRFLSFARNMSTNIGKKINKTLKVNTVRNFLIMLKASAADAIENASKRLIQKTADADGDLIFNKVADKITKVWRTSPQNSSCTVESETENIGLDREIPK